MNNGDQWDGECMFCVFIDPWDYSIERDGGGWYGVREDGAVTDYYSTSDDVCEAIECEKAVFTT
jgi:hypothetical protein